MSDQFEAPSGDVAAAPSAGVPATGHPAVDAAVSSLAHVHEQTVDEQVRLFEAAHETLRAALADAGGDRPA